MTDDTRMNEAAEEPTQDLATDELDATEEIAPEGEPEAAKELKGIEDVEVASPLDASEEIDELDEIHEIDEVEIEPADELVADEPPTDEDAAGEADLVADDDVLSAEDAVAEEDDGVETSDDAEGAGEVTLSLPAKLRLVEAEELLDALRAVPADAILVLDAGEVEDIATPGVLAIVSAIRTRGDDSPATAVERPTPAFVDAFSDLGLFQDLMKMEFRQ